MAGDGSWRGDRDQERKDQTLRLRPGSRGVARPRPHTSCVISSVFRRSPKALQGGMLHMGSLRVHHTYGGRGTPVLFVHGLGSSGYLEWRFNLEPTAASHRVYAPDLPGFGRSEKPRARYGIPYFTRFIERYMDGRGLRSAAVGGGAPGGRNAPDSALQHPPRRAQSAARRRRHEVKVPLQLIWGADAPLFPVAHATRAHALVEHSRLAVIEGAGHTPQAERPEEFNRVLHTFLSA